MSNFGFVKTKLARIGRTFCWSVCHANRCISERVELDDPELERGKDEYECAGQRAIQTSLGIELIEAVALRLFSLKKIIKKKFYCK